MQYVIQPGTNVATDAMMTKLGPYFPGVLSWPGCKNPIAVTTYTAFLKLFDVPHSDIPITLQKTN